MDSDGGERPGLEWQAEVLPRPGRSRRSGNRRRVGRLHLDTGRGTEAGQIRRERLGPRATEAQTLIVVSVMPPLEERAVDLGKGVKLEMILIPAGEFLMGSPDSDKDAGIFEKPQHRVRITKPFYLGKYLVTQEQWEAVMGNNPSGFKGPKNPVEQVVGTIARCS